MRSTRLRTLTKLTNLLQNIASSVLVKLDHKNAAVRFNLSYFRLSVFQKNPVLDLQPKKLHRVSNFTTLHT